MNIFSPLSKGIQLIDKFLVDPRAMYYKTVKSHKICFFDNSGPDPDWKIKQCYLLIITVSTELENRVENRLEKWDEVNEMQLSRLWPLYVNQQNASSLLSSSICMC